jgi:hypothetical protein
MSKVIEAFPKLLEKRVFEKNRFATLYSFQNQDDLLEFHNHLLNLMIIPNQICPKFDKPKNRKKNDPKKKCQSSIF